MFAVFIALKKAEKASWALAQFKARKAAGPPPEAEQ
jgi:hypothetical protein